MRPSDDDSMKEDFVKASLPEKITWGQDIDFKLAFPKAVAAVLVMLKRIWPEDIERDGSIKDIRKAVKEAKLISITPAFPQRPVVDLTRIPAKPTKHFQPGVYVIEYVIQNKNGHRFMHRKIYRGLEHPPT